MNTFWPLLLLVAILTALASIPDRTVHRPEYINVQTCVFSSEDMGSKLGNICSRLDPATHWALRQRI
jgi:hypothetical protein